MISMQSWSVRDKSVSRCVFKKPFNIGLSRLVPSCPWYTDGTPPFHFLFSESKGSPINPLLVRMHPLAGRDLARGRGTLLAIADWMTANTRSAAMRIQTYRDERRSRHFDLICGGERPRSIDLVLVTTSGMLAVGFICALMVPFASTVANLSQWVH
jgi:hypothetical protein